MKEVKRGCIYKYKEDDSEFQRYAMVVSADARGRDKYVSILFLTNAYLGHDVVKVAMPVAGEDMYLHCGMITYTSRDSLLYKVSQVSDDVMDQVDSIILHELGIKHDAEVELKMYKRLYEDLINRVANAMADKMKGEQDNGEEEPCDNI